MVSDEIAHLLEMGSVTFLHAPTWDAISTVDTVAGRLWTFLEAESLRDPRRYSLFAGPPHGLSEERNLPAIADLLRLDWGQRRDVARRVQRACRVIVDHDSRYSLNLVKGRPVSMWRLEAARQDKVAGPTQSRLPPAVLGVWREAYRGRRPSQRQTIILEEVLSRHPVEWVAAQLSDGAGEPMRRLLDADTTSSRDRLAAAAAYEATWAAAKQTEAAAFEPLADILRRMARPQDETR